MNGQGASPCQKETSGTLCLKTTLQWKNLIAKVVGNNVTKDYTAEVERSNLPSGNSWGLNEEVERWTKTRYYS